MLKSLQCIRYSVNTYPIYLCFRDGHGADSLHCRNCVKITDSVSIALVTALRWDILENKATVKTFRSPINWPSSILGSPIVHSVCPSSPPHFAWRMHSIWFQWENLRLIFQLRGSKGLQAAARIQSKNNNNNLYLLHIQVCKIVLTLKVAPTLIKAGQAQIKY